MGWESLVVASLVGALSGLAAGYFVASDGPLTEGALGLMSATVAEVWR